MEYLLFTLLIEEQRASNQKDENINPSETFYPAPVSIISLLEAAMSLKSTGI